MTGKTLGKARAICSSLKRTAAAGFTEILAGAWHWLVLSSAIMIGAMATVWSMLWNQPVGELMPFIGTGIIIWGYFSQVLIDCTTVFVAHGNLYRNQRMIFSVSIYCVIYKNTMILAHSLIVVLGLILFFEVPVNWYDLQIISGFLLAWITMLWAGYLVAMICVRYRDIIQLINNWLLVLFFITPILWRPNILPPQHRFLADYNPLAKFIEFLRNPLLGEPVGTSTWVSTIVIAFGGALLASPTIARYRQRVIFWT